VSNRHGNGKFAPGKSLGTYRGQTRHDASTEAFKTKLHTEQPRTPVVRHDDCPSVGTDDATLAQVSAKGATDFTGRN
jgi:hypothetical protein